MEKLCQTLKIACEQQKHERNLKSDFSKSIIKSLRMFMKLVFTYFVNFFQVQEFILYPSFLYDLKRKASTRYKLKVNFLKLRLSISSSVISQLGLTYSPTSLISSPTSSSVLFATLEVNQKIKSIFKKIIWDVMQSSFVDQYQLSYSSCLQ